MKKKHAIKDPKSCWNKAKKNERIFTLLERDPAAAAAIRYWARLRVEWELNKATDPQIVEALQEADKFDEHHKKEEGEDESAEGKDTAAVEAGHPVSNR